MHIEIGNLTSQIAGAVTSTMSDFSPVFALVLGLAMAFWVIEEIIDIMRFNRENDIPSLDPVQSPKEIRGNDKL